MNETVSPTFTVWFLGWVVMTGTFAAAFTVSVTVLDQTLPCLLETRQRYLLPFCCSSAVTVYTAEAPSFFTAFHALSPAFLLYHW